MSDSEETNLPPADTVMIVDNEILVRFAIAQYLRECGFCVVEAASADEATTVLQDNRLGIDIILCDVDAPGSQNGFKLAQWVRTNRPEISIILAANSARSAQAAGDLCEDGPTLSKPYDPQLLLDRIKKLLAQRGRKP